MTHGILKSWLLAVVTLVASASRASAQYPGWRHTGSLHILTTPDGADLPATAVERDFPLLVRLHKDFFDFSQARADGADVRFSTRAGAPLAYQVEEWDAANGTASIWVRVPVVRGNEDQEIRVHWGRVDSASESNGAAVFNESNGYLSVWHMGGVVKDEVGTLESKDVGTTPTRGIIVGARHLAGQQGIFCGDKITGYPVGSGPHSTEAWFRPEQANGRVLAWGNEHAQGKVVMHFQSPPHVKMECYFSGADVSSTGRMAMNEWVHVVHTYEKGDSKVYVDGVLEAVSKNPRSPLALKSPARLWLGGWYDDYDFVGDLDEVRVSKVVRSPHWVRLQHENQKALQTLAGPIVPPGTAFDVSPSAATVLEGGRAVFTARAGGARKVFWVLKSGGEERVVATDRLSYGFDAGRVTGDRSATLVFKAVFADGVRTKEIPITVKEDIQEPVFTLKAPATWDGRTPIEVLSQVANLAAMKAKGAGELKFDWKVGGIATIKEIVPGKLRLERAQNSGRLTVTATVSNGGRPATQTVTIAVKEPEHDAWVARVPDPDEKPVDGQFYARDDKDEGTLFYNGRLDVSAASVFLKIYADGRLQRTVTARPAADGSYALSAKLKPGLIRYKAEFGTRDGGRETILRTVTNLVCGDAYVIQGQSNALATDTDEKAPLETSEWIRSYGRRSLEPDDASGNFWCLPVWRAQEAENAEIGWWGMELAKRLVASQKMPIFIVNGAVGGTRIDQHQRNEADPADLRTIYGRMFWRVRQAKLTHGIRGILWHQGENNQGTAGPTGDYDWKTYEDLFVEMSAGWKRDFPNLRHTYVFQIWPNSCSMAGDTGAGDMIREIQRGLPRLYSHLSVMSTLGITPPGGCHFPLVGWAEFARLIQPLIERDHYGRKPAGSITPPDLRSARFTSAARDAIALVFDQPIVWNDALAGQFYLDGAKGKVSSGRLEKNVLTLTLKEPSAATKITYLKESAWSQDKLVRGTNGIAALSFCDVTISR